MLYIKNCFSKSHTNEKKEENDETGFRNFQKLLASVAMEK